MHDATSSIMKSETHAMCVFATVDKVDIADNDGNREGTPPLGGSYGDIIKSLMKQNCGNNNRIVHCGKEHHVTINSFDGVETFNWKRMFHMSCHLLPSSH